MIQIILITVIGIIAALSYRFADVFEANERLLNAIERQEQLILYGASPDKLLTLSREYDNFNWLGLIFKFWVPVKDKWTCI
jgi:hypothetical protein